MFSKPKLYTCLDDIIISSFFKILDTKDMKYMFKDSKLHKKYEGLANKNWMDIYDEYLDVTENSESVNYFRLIDELSYLKLRYKVIGSLIESLNEHNKELVGKELNAWGVIFNIKGTVKDQEENLLRFLRASKNKILRKTSELEEITKREDKKKFNFIEQKMRLTHITGINIDADKMVMTEWIETEKIAEQIIKSRQKEVSRNG